MIGYDLRFKPKLQRLRQKIVDGFLGDVVIAEAIIVSNGPFSERRGVYGPTPVPDWWFEKELVGGGALLDLGCHMIDLFVWFFGEVKEAKGYLGYKLNMEVEDTATVVLEFKKGQMAIVNAGWFSKERLSVVNLCGTAGNISVLLSPSSTFSVIWKDVKRKLGWLKDDGDYLEAKYFVNCLQRDESPHPSGEEGLLSLQAIALAYNHSSKCNLQ